MREECARSSFPNRDEAEAGREAEIVAEVEAVLAAWEGRGPQEEEEGSVALLPLPPAPQKSFCTELLVLVGKHGRIAYKAHPNAC